jgi:demethylmenaquinone methyltransferase/2-methoxy-6-polyprenyl-1,4-benzoquinol methylase
VPFRATFDCLWCGTPHATRSPQDLEGWAQLCPSCVGKAGDNGFLRYRLRQALAERSAAAGGDVEPGDAEPGDAETGDAAPDAAAGSTPGLDRAMVEYYAARAPEYDDWYLRRGRYSHGPIHDAAWDAELDAAGRWLDALPLRGEIVDLAAGTGWWSTLLAGKGELSLYDAAPETLERARERLVAHGLRAHLHVRDAWAEPDREVDALFVGFWLSHIPRARLGAFLALARRWLKPGGRLAVIDSQPDPASGAVDHPVATDDRSVRRLADGREFTIVKVYYRPEELERALATAGFSGIAVTTTGRFFVLGSATAG